MTKLFYAASAAAILTIAGHMPAMAQSSMSSPMITCRDLTSMDRETARGVVFYMSGFHAASGSQSASSSGTTGSGSSTTGSSGSSGSTSADAGSSASGSSGTTTGSSGASGTGTDTTGSTTAAGGSSGSSGSSGSGSASGSGGGSSTMVAQIPGFSGIDVDKIMTDCASSPDKQLSDMMSTMQ